jgi:hypothetical protein
MPNDDYLYNINTRPASRSRRRSVQAARLRAAFAMVEPMLHPAAPRHDAERLRAARQRLATAVADSEVPRLMTNPEMSQYRDGLDAARHERLGRLAALELEMMEPNMGRQKGRRNELVRSNQDNFDTGMPYSLASHLGRM